MMNARSVISLRDVSIGFNGRNGETIKVLKNINLSVARGETVGLVGESGSGKSTIALAAMGFLKLGLKLLTGSAHFDGHDMFALDPKQLGAIRGGKLGLVPQNAGQALTPTLRIGRQIEEALKIHSDIPKEDYPRRVTELLADVRLPDPENIASRFPHELSGGQQQRVAIAMAMAGDPIALILDEPTTGLDVTTQVHILDLLSELAREREMALIYVSHDLGVIARVCERVLVMRNGEVVKEGPVVEVLTRPDNAYVQELLDAIPRLNSPRLPSALKTVSGPDSAVLKLDRLCITHARSGLFDQLMGRPTQPNTVEDVTFDLYPGETIGLVGESGSGKSTILKTLAGLLPPSGGKVRLAGDRPLPPMVKHRPPDLLRSIQLIFQSPDDSLNPRHSVAQTLAQPLELYQKLSGPELRNRSIELLEQVRLSEKYLGRLPRQLSGGEKQRVAIARAFAAKPDIILCDEITSALDVSVQASVLDLMSDLRSNTGAAYIFVSHDLAVVRSLSDRVIVLQNGRICEVGETEALFGNPQHPYTQLLLDAVLDPTPQANLQDRQPRSAQSMA